MGNTVKIKSRRTQKSYDAEFYEKDGQLVITHTSLENIYWAMPDGERPQMDIEAMDLRGMPGIPSMFALKCVLTDMKTGCRYEQIGETLCSNWDLANQVARSFPLTTCRNMAFDRAFIRYMQFDLSAFDIHALYSSAEIPLENGDAVPVTAKGIQLEAASGALPPQDAVPEQVPEQIQEEGPVQGQAPYQMPDQIPEEDPGQVQEQYQAPGQIPDQVFPDEAFTGQPFPDEAFQGQGPTGQEGGMTPYYAPVQEPGYGGAPTTEGQAPWDQAPTQAPGFPWDNGNGPEAQPASFPWGNGNAPQGGWVGFPFEEDASGLPFGGPAQMPEYGAPSQSGNGSGLKKPPVLSLHFDQATGRAVLGTAEGEVFYDPFSNQWSSQSLDLNAVDKEYLYERGSELACIALKDYNGQLY